MWVCRMQINQNQFLDTCHFSNHKEFNIVKGLPRFVVVRKSVITFTRTRMGYRVFPVSFTVDTHLLLQQLVLVSPSPQTSLYYRRTSNVLQVDYQFGICKVHQWYKPYSLESSQVMTGFIALPKDFKNEFCPFTCCFLIPYEV